MILHTALQKTVAESESDFSITLYHGLMGELWGVYCEDFGANCTVYWIWSRTLHSELASLYADVTLGEDTTVLHMSKHWHDLRLRKHPVYIALEHIGSQ